MMDDDEVKLAMDRYFRYFLHDSHVLIFLHIKKQRRKPWWRFDSIISYLDYLERWGFLDD